MFGNLVLVDSLVLVDWYNCVFKYLIGLEMGLDEFYIDILGFLFEVGDELNNCDYLNFEGVNCQFIILSIE